MMQSFPVPPGARVNDETGNNAPASQQFRAPTVVIAGRGSRRLVSEWVDRLRGARPIVVADAGLLQSSPLVAEISASLSDAGLAACAKIGIAPDPTVREAERVRTVAREVRADLVVAIGGGSALDAAKCGAMLATNDEAPLSYVGRNLFANTPLPMIALPTTCGTGSEVSWVSVLRDPGAQRKVSIKGDGMFPRLAILDPDFLAGLPARQVAWTGMDALTHAIEAYLAIGATRFSDAHAVSAAAELFEVLPGAMSGNGESLERAQLAATQAGFAFGNSDVGAVHCLSETLGGLYQVPHGLANAALLVPVLRFYGEAATSRLASLARRVRPQAHYLNDRDAAEGLLIAIEHLARTLEIPPFSALEVPGETYGMIAEIAVTNNSNGSCPRPMHSLDYVRILRGA
jgi:alcohol dehydrogenase